MRKLYLFSVILSVIAILDVHSQSFFSFKKNREPQRKKLYEKHSSLAFGLGTSHYFGDIAPYTNVVPSLIQDIRWNAGVAFQRHLSPHWALRLGFTWVRIAGDDNHFQGKAGFEQLFMRNAHFRNDLQELSVMGVYNIIKENRNSYNRPQWIPYLFGGLAIFHHNPVAMAPSGLNDIQPKEWVSLQPLGTEGQGLPGYAQPYSLISASIPLGAGVSYKLNKTWDIGFEVSLRYSFTDYLDDIGGAYANPDDLQNSNLTAFAFGHRELEKYAIRTGNDREPGIRAWFAAVGNPLYADPNFPLNSIVNPDGFDRNFTRNSTAKINDSYLLTTIKLVYHITPSIKCPKLK
ncbi:DUF6089 family protein [Flectobacillus major]|uniref:DUF6089 family protein n=1 Tax=Flectobacillus major TaxID=103 RepID=UPI0003FCD37D|nr:DUF6089 family protein [Flectobacillus major]